MRFTYYFKLYSNFLFSCSIFVFYLIYLFNTPYSFLPYDAGQYWETSALFFKNKSFSIVNFNDSLRGYLYPLLNLPGKLISYFFNIDPLSITRIFGSITATLLFSSAIPHLWQSITRLEFPNFKQRTLLVLLSFIFWRDYFHFPLTDFPAILCICYSLILIFKNINERSLIIAGILIMAAINLRPIYIISFPFFLFFIIRQRTSANIFKRLGFLSIGILIISLPQLLINIHQQNSFSPLVHPVMAKQSKGLYLKQLEWGIVIQKYETSIDDSYPNGSLVFSDPVGKVILKTEKLRLPLNFGSSNQSEIITEKRSDFQEINNYDEYFKLVFKYPIDFAVIYARHIFNGLDIQYPSPYIIIVYNFNVFFVILNYSIIFLFLLIVISQNIEKFHISHFLILCIFLSPCLVAIPTAIECRFFLTFHLLIYSTVIFAWPKKWSWQTITSQVNFGVLFFYVLFIIICLTMSSQTQINLAINPRTFNVFN